MKKSHKVEVYSAVWCPWCTKTKDFLKANKVAFIEKDVDADPKYGQELADKTGQRGIPVTVIDGKSVIIGYDTAGLKKALEL